MSGIECEVTEILKLLAIMKDDRDKIREVRNKKKEREGKKETEKKFVSAEITPLATGERHGLMTRNAWNSSLLEVQEE